MKFPYLHSYYHRPDSQFAAPSRSEPDNGIPLGEFAFTAFFEISNPFQLRPSYFKGRFGKGYCRRFVWLWFACGWVPYRLDQWHDRIASGLVKWADR